MAACKIRESELSYRQMDKSFTLTMIILRHDRDGNISCRKNSRNCGNLLSPIGKEGEVEEEEEREEEQKKQEASGMVTLSIEGECVIILILIV